jgi:tRNA(Ile)-lysidine synthase
LRRSKEKYLLSFSSGPDSCYLLEQVRKSLPSDNLFLIYFDHGLRLKSEIGKEKDLIKKVAKEYSLKFFIESLAVKKIAKQEKKSIETTARDLRKAALIKKAKELGAKFVLTAHHLDDSLETLILRLIRGAKSNLFQFDAVKEFDGIYFVKPLLSFTKKEILNYLSTNKIDYLVDQTNQETVFVRNKIRNKIVPILEEINLGFRKNIADSISYFSELNHFLCDLLAPSLSQLKKEQGRLEISFALFNNLAPFLQKEFLFQAAQIFAEHKFQVESKYIEEIFYACQSHKKFKMILPQNNFVIVSKGKVVFAKKLEEKIAPFSYFIREIPTEIYIQEIDKLAKFSLLKNNFGIDLKSAKVTYLDFDLLLEAGVFKQGAAICQTTKPLEIRSKKSGDRFNSFGLNGQSKILKKYLIDKKIDQEQRQRLPLLCVQNKILAILGQETSSLFKVSNATKLILRIDF